VSFSVLKRPPGSRRLAHFPVGSYPLVSLAEARRRARDILREIEDGVDPRARRAEEARQTAAEKASTFAAVAEVFISRHVASKRTAPDIESRIRRELISRWGGRPIGSITRADVITMVDEIIDRGHPEAARQTLVYARRLFNWAVPRYDLQHAPTDHLAAKDLIGVKKPRQRVLTDAELALIWKAAGGLEAAYGSFIRLLMLTGVRRSELGRAPWSEIDLEAAVWTIPPERAKMDDPIVISLSAPAIEILRELHQNRSAHADATFVVGSFLHYLRVTRYLNRRMTALNGGEPIPHFTLHDVRRTFRTGLSRLQIAPHIAELCIGHRQPGLHRIYDLHKFDAEKRHAFDAWAAHVMRIVEPPDRKVRPLRPAR